MKYLLDANVFSELGRSKRHANLETWNASVDDSELAVSAITVREVWTGVAKLRGAKPDVTQQIEKVVTTVLEAFGERVLAIDQDVARLWGEQARGVGRIARVARAPPSTPWASGSLAVRRCHGTDTCFVARGAVC